MIRHCLKSSTIAAIATGKGAGGIGIVKISGPRAVAIARKMFQPTGIKQDPAGQPSHVLQLGKIVDPDDGMMVDQVLLCVMRAPRSYTGEDVVEINAHAGEGVLRRILQLVLDQGAEPAQPGEFTQRAFLNGKIDLSQAEAVADLVNARSRSALDNAARQVRGELARSLGRVRRRLEAIMAELEAGIDFEEEVGLQEEARDTALGLLSGVIEPLEQLKGSYRWAAALQEGQRVVVCGKTNVGKSSLVNRLLCEERIIVSDTHGTTRDVIREPLDLQGLQVTVIDTAGLRDGRDPIEKIGIAKSVEEMQAADLVLLVLDASRPLDRDDEKAYRHIPDAAARIHVLNKNDLARHGVSTVRPLPDHWAAAPMALVSAKNGQGLEQLRSIIAQAMKVEMQCNDSETVIVNLRQKRVLDLAIENLRKGGLALEEGMSAEWVLEDLKHGLDALGQISGETIDVDLLEHIFSRFCIGK